MFAPAMIPVTAGKNSANMVKKLSPSAKAGSALAASRSNRKYIPAPAKADTSDSPSTAKMPYCTRMAHPAPT